MIVATPSKGGRGRGVLDQLTKDLKAVMKLLFQYMVPLKVVSVEEQREKAIAKLVKPINVTDRSDSTAKTMSDNGMADTSEASTAICSSSIFDLKCDVKSLSKRPPIKSSKKMSNLRVIKAEYQKHAKVIS